VSRWIHFVPFLFGFLLRFQCDKAKKNDQSDHLNFRFFSRRLGVQKLGWNDKMASKGGFMDTPSVSQERVTELLVRWSQGDDAALAELTPLVYEELRRLAHRQMGGERPDHTLQTTALVNEAYLRLADHTNLRWQNRAHFFAVAARAMRRILVSYARSQRSEKRGGGRLKMELDETALVSPEESKEIVALHEALEQLATLDSRKAQVVELKYFGGLNYEEMADVLKISPVTVRRDWRFAKAWLYTELLNTG
jgi:RNA polymerase sigma factor (TIGR02999 family)